MFLCFTDLDGTLLNHNDYRYDAAIPTIKKLQNLGIPVMPTTSKTKAEVLELRSALGLQDPFIVENGSGIFLAAEETRFDFAPLLDAESLTLTEMDERQTVILGVTYEQARQGLRQLAEQLRTPLQGFGDLSLEALGDLTALPKKDLQQACDRQFSEPFVKPDIAIKKMAAIAAKQNLQILEGNRFCHLLGAGAAKGRAVKLLTQAWQHTHPNTVIKTIGLGDSPNDLSMLETVDFPIVIPGVNGCHPELMSYIEKYGWQVAPDTGCKGWSIMVEKAISQL
ncbi:MAG: HAD-IIB family hydrolase [Limnothrix sp.]